MMVRSACGGFDHEGIYLIPRHVISWLLVLELIGWAGLFPRSGPVFFEKSPDGQIQVTQAAEIEFSPWDLVTAIDWSPDGAILAVAAGNSIYLYHSGDWGLISNIAIGALTHGLDFSPDGNLLAAGSRDGALRIWEMAQIRSGSALGMSQHLAAHRKGVNAVRFSPQGSLLASGGNDAIARFWGARDGAAMGMTIGGSFAVPSIDFSLDGQVLAVVNGNVIRLRETGSERIVGTFQSDVPLFHVEFSPDGAVIAAAGNDNRIRLWKTDQAYRTNQPVYPAPLLLTGHSGSEGTFRALVWKAIFSPDGNILASAGGDGTIRWWNPQNGVQLASQSAHRGGATSLAFHPDGSQIASGGLDGRVIIWSLNP